MGEKCKYRELKYKRPDIEMVAKTLDDIADKVGNAKSYQEVKALYETYEFMQCIFKFKIYRSFDR